MLLEYENELLLNSVQENQLCVLAKGIPLERVGGFLKFEIEFMLSMNVRRRTILCNNNRIVSLVYRC